MEFGTTAWSRRMPADPTLASQLVAEDSFASRGTTARVEEELELLRSERADQKGQQRQYDTAMPEQSTAPSAPRHSRSHSDSSHDRLHHRRTESSSSRQRRLLWWREAAINVVYILAWCALSFSSRRISLIPTFPLRYTFSTVISVYSQSPHSHPSLYHSEPLATDKWMFAPEHYNFPYPLFVTSVHMVVQWSLSALVLTTFKSLRSPNRPKSKDYLCVQFFNSSVHELRTATNRSKVIPCGMATGLDIGLSNLSLRTITLSFYSQSSTFSQRNRD